jgi:hypothetical protein
VVSARIEMLLVGTGIQDHRATTYIFDGTTTTPTDRAAHGDVANR